MSKRIYTCILLVLICSIISGCSNTKVIKSSSNSSTISGITSVPNETTQTIQNQVNNSFSGFAGIYKYDYKNDTEDLIEDHYIVLEYNDSHLEGRYYGTSDDFDEAREGYYPGFFVTKMQNLQITGSEITFTIELNESDMFSKSIDLRYKTSKDVPLNENPIWINAQMIEGNDKNPRNYKGIITNDKIIIDVDNDKRVFIKSELEDFENAQSIETTESITVMNSSKNCNPDEVLKEFKDYLKTLDVEDINSIKEATKKCKSLLSSNYDLNDELIRKFSLYYRDVLDKYEDYFTKENPVITEETFEANGFAVVGDEAGTFVHEDPNYLYNNFSSYISGGMKEFLKIHSDEMNMRAGGYLLVDGLLFISWDQLSDLIIIDEQYINTYSIYPAEVDEIKSDLNFFLYLYFENPSLKTFAYMNDETTDNELEKSYIRFIDMYPSSHYQPIVKGYYEILKSNGFQYDDKAKDYLKNSGIDVS